MTAVTKEGLIYTFDCTTGDLIDVLTLETDAKITSFVYVKDFLLVIKISYFTGCLQWF